MRWKLHGFLHPLWALLNSPCSNLNRSSCRIRKIIYRRKKKREIAFSIQCWKVTVKGWKRHENSAFLCTCSSVQLLFFFFFPATVFCICTFMSLTELGLNAWIDLHMAGTSFHKPNWAYYDYKISNVSRAWPSVIN